MATFRGGGVSSIDEFYISKTVRSCMNPSYKNAQKRTVCVESAKHSSQPVAGKMCSLPFVYQLLSSKFVREADGFNAVAASIGISARNRHPCMRGMVGTGEMSTSANKKTTPTQNDHIASVWSGNCYPMFKFKSTATPTICNCRMACEQRAIVIDHPPVAMMQRHNNHDCRQTANIPN